MTKQSDAYLRNETPSFFSQNSVCFFLWFETGSFMVKMPCKWRTFDTGKQGAGGHAKVVQVSLGVALADCSKPFGFKSQVAKH